MFLIIFGLNKLSPHHPRICNDFCQFPWYQLILEILGQAGGTWNASGIGERGTGKSYPSATCEEKGKNSLPDYIKISNKLKNGEYKNGMEFSLNRGTYPHRKCYMKKGETAWFAE